MAVHFYFADVKTKLSNRLKLKSFIEEEIYKTNRKKIQLSYVFCSDAYLLEINRQFLQHDYYTDIITFPLQETANFIEAEIYISVDRVSENALRLRTNRDQELLRVMFHGVLHLLGYKDHKRADKVAMRAAEESWLKRWEKSLSHS